MAPLRKTDQAVGETIPDIRRGRPRSTSARALEVIALDLFRTQGFAGTSVDDIAAEAGVSRRTFFRYFDSKADVLWSSFDDEVARLREALAAIETEVDLLDGIRAAVLSVNHYRAEDVPELRARIDLIGSVPELAASASVHYDAWERAVIEFAAYRRGESPDDLLPLAIGRATLAVCRAAYERWANRADADLTHYLDQAIRALSAGFSRDRFPDEATPV